MANMTDVAALEVVVVGAGVVGLTTAVRLLEAGHRCVVVAKEVLAGTTSHTAASWWIPDPEYGKLARHKDGPVADHPKNDEEVAGHPEQPNDKKAAGNPKQQNDGNNSLDCGFGSRHYQKWARETFHVMHDQFKQQIDNGTKLCDGSRYLCSLEQTEEWRNIWFRHFLPSFHIEELPNHPTFHSVVNFSTIMTRMDAYLAWLRGTVVQLGGRINPSSDGHEGAPVEVESLQEAARFFPSASILINCAGLNAAKLSEKHNRSPSQVSSEEIFPIRGQTVLVEAPQVQRHLSIGLAPLTGSNDEDDIGTDYINLMKKRPVYVIPQGDGTVICGGSKEGRSVNASPSPDVVLQEEIIRNCSRLEPSLRNAPVIKNVVGFRPFRKGGVRLAVDSKPIVVEEDGERRVVDVVHNYGHADVGVILSWGCAAQVVEIIKEIQNETKKSRKHVWLT